jgi:hypothetical protein
MMMMKASWKFVGCRDLTRREKRKKSIREKRPRSKTKKDKPAGAAKESEENTATPCCTVDGVEVKREEVELVKLMSSANRSKVSQEVEGVEAEDEEEEMFQRRSNTSFTCEHKQKEQT